MLGEASFKLKIITICAPIGAILTLSLEVTNLSRMSPA